MIFACIPMQLCELRLMKFEKILGPGSQSQLWLLMANDNDDVNDDDFDQQTTDIHDEDQLRNNYQPTNQNYDHFEMIQLNIQQSNDNVQRY